MKKIFLILMVAMLGSGMAFAEDGLKVEVEGMFMEVFGADEHVGDVYTFYDEYMPYEYENYGAIYDPINLNMDPNFAIRGEVLYMINQWGLGVSGWYFQTSGALNGHVESSPGSISGVRMWGHTLLPLTDTSHPSGYAPKDYYASQDLLVWTAEAFLIRTLAEKPKSEINMSLGGKVGNLIMTRENGTYTNAWVDDWFGDGLAWDNDVYLEETANSDFLGFGPMIGFTGNAKMGMFYVEGFLYQSVLLGLMTVDDVWIDIDDIYITSEDGWSEPYETWTGTFDFFKEEFMAVPVTEFQIEFGFDIADLVRIGVGGFTSIWWNAPVPPTWHVPGDWYWARGSGFDLEYRNLVFAGAKATATIKLGGKRD